MRVCIMRNLLAVLMRMKDSRHYHESAVPLLETLFRQLDSVALNQNSRWTDVYLQLFVYESGKNLDEFNLV